MHPASNLRRGKQSETCAEGGVETLSKEYSPVCRASGLVRGEDEGMKYGAIERLRGGEVS